MEIYNKGSGNMNLFAMKASYPLDELTKLEMTSLVDKNQQQDALDYSKLMHAENWSDVETRGFFVLAYDDDEDALVGMISAIDTLGLNAFEWSLLVDVDYRNIGIEEVLIEGLKHGLDERQASGEMVATFAQQNFKPLLKNTGYQYSSSKVVMEALPTKQQVQTIQVTPYEEKDLAHLQELMADGFQDLPEETEEFIELVHQEPSTQVWMVRQENKVVATLTTAIIDETIWVTAFTTANEFRKQGIALSLLKWVKNYASEKNIRSILLEVELDNVGAYALYDKAGFAIKEQQDYYIVD
ncbi:MAG: GNAT family N-acetyltransferase [Kurthia sp.]|nr:GNAT family N-acetyltransferase [Candidatus Kurthia equi]